jgi:hypothetical protein
MTKMPLMTAVVSIMLATAMSLWVMERVTVTLGCVVLMIVAAIVANRFLAKNPTARTSTAWFGFLVALAYPIFVGMTDAPLKVAFWSVKGRFESLAEQMVTGVPPSTPVRIGPFVVKKVGVRGMPPVPFFLTSGHLSEINGFVKDPHGDGFNLWSLIQLDGGWSYISED